MTGDHTPDEFEARIAGAVDAVAASGSVPAGGAAAAMAGGARRQQRMGIMSAAAVMLLFLAGVVGFTQLSGGDPGATEVATEVDDLDDPSPDRPSPAATATPVPSPPPEPTVVPTVPADDPVATPPPTTPDPDEPTPTATAVPGTTPVTATPGPTVTTTPVPTLTPTPNPASSVTLSGTVSTSDGAAIANAQISVSGASATTSATGAYSLTVAPGDYVMGVFLTQPSGGATLLVHSESFNVNADLTKDLVIQKPVTLQVTLLDSNGQPVAGADVGLSGLVEQSHISGFTIAPANLGLENEWASSANTDDTGVVTLYPYGGANSFSVWAPGVPHFNVPWDGVAETVTVNLPAAVTVTGTVALANGTPLANVYVSFTGTQSVVTDASGNYSAEVSAGQVGVQVQSLPPTPGYNEFLFSSPARSITGNTTWDFTLANPTALEVTVLNASGAPVPNYDVSLSGSLDQMFVLGGTTIVDPGQDIDNGWYTHDITDASGKVTLYLFGDGTDQSVSVAAPDGSPRQLFPWDGVSSTLTINLVSNPVIGGSILTSAGGSYAYCGISFSGGDGGAAYCDGGGNFSVEMPSGTYTPTVQADDAPGQPNWIFTGAPITFTGTTNIGIQAAAPVNLTVTVLDADGNPVSNADVVLSGAMTNAFVSGLTIDPGTPGADNGWDTYAATNASGEATVYPFAAANNIAVTLPAAQTQTFAWDGEATTITVQLT